MQTKNGIFFGPLSLTNFNQVFASDKGQRGLTPLIELKG
jgi:hypothetical protein